MSGKRALVLSAGGFFGAYQAGAWAALEKAVSFDMVVGASVGALNAWYIASGHSAASLAERWMDLKQLSQPRWRFPRQWRDGLFDSAALEALIRLMHEELRPQASIGVVATELGRLRPRLFRDGEIGWRHLVASCAVFALLPQIRIDGVTYTDGGLLGAVPAWAAAEMGADSIVAINVLPRMPLPIRLPLTALRKITRQPPTQPPGVRMWTIAPGEPLGRVADAVRWRRENIERWIEQGRRDTERLLATFPL